MFIVDFRNTLVSKYCFSVMNNNDVDVVHIYSHFVQYANYLCYLKVESEDKDYVDEFLIDSENIEVVDNALLVKWTMGEISTQCKKINIQLEFRESNAENSKIAQSKIVSIVLADTIDTSEGSKRLYPNILKYLQEQIDTLKDDSVAGFTMSYVSDVLTINLKNADDESVAQLQVNIPTDNKVDKIAGKGLSTNDFTDALKNKLDGIMAGAQVNVIEGVKVDGVELTPDENKKVNITNKVTKTTDANKVYGTDGSGNQTTMPVDNAEGKDGNVARRKQTSGQVSVPTTPVANDDATSKQYVDAFGKTIELEIDSTTYVLTARLKDANGNVLATQQVDLPLESVVVSGSYDSATQSIILTLQNGSTITIPVAGLISGLVSQTDFDALALRVTTAEGNIITLGNTKVNYSDITISGGFVIAITKNGSTYPIAEVVNVSATPVVVQSTSDLPAQNDGNLYVVLDNGYLYAWSNGWQQLYPYTSDLLTITEVTAGEVIYSYISDKGHSNRPIQVESAVRDGEGNIINDTYAKKVGYEPQLRVGTADNIYSDRTIDDPETACPPIVMGTTGGEAEIKTGIENFEYMEGKSKKFNQFVKIRVGTYTDKGITLTPDANADVNGFVILNGTATDNAYVSALAVDWSVISGHKYVCIWEGLTGITGVQWYWGYNVEGVRTNVYSSGGNIIHTANGNASCFSYIVVANGVTLNNLKVRFMLIDLTAIYGAGNEPTSVEQFKADYPLDYYPYNAGEILSAKASKLISRGRQQWDEETDVGSISNEGALITGNYLRSKNFIPVIRNETYNFRIVNGRTIWVYFYDENKNFIKLDIGSQHVPYVTLSPSSGYIYKMPNNAYYIKFLIDPVYGTTYNHDITISIYFEDGEGYDEYYSYSAQEVTLPNIELRSVPDYTNGGEIKDIAYAQGGGKRRVGFVDLGSLNWQYDSGNRRFYTSDLATIKAPTSADEKANILCAKYETETYNDTNPLTHNFAIGAFSGGNTKYVDVSDTNYNDPTDFKTAMSGVYLLYELATETDLTENEGWVEQVLVDNYGTLQFVTDPQQVPQVEQPYYIEYTIDLVEFLDSSYTRAGGDASNFALVEEVEQAKENVEEALKNGSLKPANSDLADNFTPYDEDSGAEQNIPFINQGTGCGNGETSVDTGSVALMRKKEGNLVIGNQRLINGDFSNGTNNWSSSYSTISASNNKGTATGLADSTRYWFGFNKGLTGEVVAGHKYIFAFTLNAISISNFSGFGFMLNDGNSNYYNHNFDGTLGFKCVVLTSTSNAIQFYLNAILNDTSARPTTSDYFTISNVFLIDLTQMFGSNDRIPAYLLAHPEAFFNYYQGSLAYNVGTPIVSNATTLKTIGRNLFDVSTAIQGKKVNATGEIDDNANYYASDYIEILPNTSYHFKDVGNSTYVVSMAFYDLNKNFIEAYSIYTSGGGYNSSGLKTSPINAKYVRLSIYKDYVNACVVSIYYEGESGYDQYYPYEVLSEVNTGNEVLRSAGSVRDYKEPNGTIHRLVGRVDLGDLNFQHVESSGRHIFIATLSDLRLAYNPNAVINAMCHLYNPTTTNATWVDKDMGYYASYNTNTIALVNNSYTDATAFKQAMTGVYLFYELAEETTEEGTPFAENLDIDDFGSMMWEGEGFNGIPMGNEIFYPVDYKASLDTLINHCDGGMESIVLDTDLEESEAVRDSVDTQLFTNAGGILRQLYALKNSVDFENVAVIDITQCTSWSNEETEGGTGVFTCYAPTGKKYDWSGSYILCPIYKVIGASSVADMRTRPDMTIAGGGANLRILIKDSSLTGLTGEQAKAKLKGILLAYEKAS